MTYGQLDTISRKIQNRCGLEQPTKTTYVKDDEGKIHIKFWFESLILPKYLQNEEEEFTNKQKGNISNAFSDTDVYKYDDDFLIEEYNVDEGWVKVLPDDQDFTIKESVDRKRLTEEEESPVEAKHHIFIYWPTQFVGKGNESLRDATTAWLKSAATWANDFVKEKEKDDLGGQDPIVKIVITGTADSNEFLRIGNLSDIQNTLGIENPEVFMIAGTGTFKNDVISMSKKDHSYVVEYPGVEYQRDTFEGIKTVQASPELISGLKNLLTKEDEILKDLSTTLQGKVLQKYVMLKTDGSFEKFNRKYVSKHSNTPEQADTEESVTKSTDLEVKTEAKSYRNNLLYKLYEAGEDVINNGGLEKGEVLSDETSKSEYLQYEAARDWYTSNLAGDGIAKIYSMIIGSALNGCSVAEAADEIAHSKKFFQSLGNEFKTKFKSIGRSTLDDAGNWLQTLRSDTLENKFTALVPTSATSAVINPNDSDPFAIAATTETKKTKTNQDTNTDMDMGIINIVYTSLFKDGEEFRKKACMVYGLDYIATPTAKAETKEGTTETTNESGSEETNNDTNGEAQQ